MYLLIIIGSVGAMLANFIDDIIQDGMILSSYGKWLRAEENRNKEIELHNNIIQNNIDNEVSNIEEVEFIKSVKEKFWKKPIGGCMRCTAFWTTVLTGILFYYAYPLFCFTSTIVIANTFLTFLIKLQK